MVTKSAGHRERSALQRFILPSEIIPRHEQRLHGRMMAQTLGMAVRKPSEPAKRHAHGQFESLNLRGAYPNFVAIAEDWQLLYVWLSEPDCSA